MRLYFEVARRTYGRISTYRSATLAGVFTNTVFGFLLAYVLLAVYRERTTVDGFDATDAVTFTFVAQGLLMVLGVFGDREMADRITTGDVALDLQRPYDHQAWWAGVSYGKAAYYAIFRGIPPFLAGAVVFHLRLPADPTQAVLFVVSVTLGVAVAFGWRYLLGLTAFWRSTSGAPTSSAGWWPSSWAACSCPSSSSPPGWRRRPGPCPSPPCWRSPSRCGWAGSRAPGWPESWPSRRRGRRRWRWRGGWS